MNPEAEARREQVKALRDFANRIVTAERSGGGLVIQGLGTHIRQAANEIESLGCITAEDDPAMLRMREAAAYEKVVKLALMCAADNYDQRAEDPGDQADYNEDMLRDAVCQYRDAIFARRAYGA